MFVRAITRETYENRSNIANISAFTFLHRYGAFNRPRDASKKRWEFRSFGFNIIIFFHQPFCAVQKNNIGSTRTKKKKKKTTESSVKARKSENVLPQTYCWYIDCQNSFSGAITTRGNWNNQPRKNQFRHIWWKKCFKKNTPHRGLATVVGRDYEVISFTHRIDKSWKTKNYADRGEA